MKAQSLLHLKNLAVLLLLSAHLWAAPEQKKDTTLILTFDMKEEVAPPLWRKTQRAFDEAERIKANVILIHMNTYGGMLESADSIRTRILNCKIPVYVFIDNNAASAGALISIACDKIYMRPGSNIGAATVVNQTGEQMPDKYQSYMRSMMRATAESHGKDTLINGTDTTFKWKRDPLIAEAMVDPDTRVPGIIDTGKVITFTATEAVKYGFCDGIAESLQEVVEEAALNPAIIKEYKPSGLDHVIGFLINPIVHSLLIIVIFGGIYFELQTPGIGFPLAAAVTAAILYFAPLYLEGIAQHWEIALFFVGLILIAVEIFAIPGFGITGISGIILTITGLTLAMVDKLDFTYEPPAVVFQSIFKSLVLVLGSILVAFIASLYGSKKMFTSQFFGGKLTLKATQLTNEGFVGVENKKKELVGKEGIADTMLRPAGNVRIDDELYDARAAYGLIEKGTKIKVIGFESNQLVVVKSS